MSAIDPFWTAPLPATGRGYRRPRPAALAGSLLLHLGILLAVLLVPWSQPPVEATPPVVTLVFDAPGAAGASGGQAGGGGAGEEAGRQQPGGQPQAEPAPKPEEATAQRVERPSVPPAARDAVAVTIVDEPVPPPPPAPAETAVPEPPPAPREVSAPTQTTPRTPDTPPKPVAKPAPPRPTKAPARTETAARRAPAKAPPPPPAEVAEARPQPAPAAPVAVDQQVAQARTGSPGDVGAGSAGGAAGVGQGATGSGAGVLGEGQGPGDDYLDRLRRHLARYKRFPEDADRAKQKGQVVVRFVVLRDGTIIDPRIEESSGVPSLDAAALDMLRQGSPAPPLPAVYRPDRLDLALPVNFRRGFFWRGF